MSALRKSDARKQPNESGRPRNAATIAREGALREAYLRAAQYEEDRQRIIGSVIRGEKHIDADDSAAIDRAMELLGFPPIHAPFYAKIDGVLMLCRCHPDEVPRLFGTKLSHKNGATQCTTTSQGTCYTNL